MNDADHSPWRDGLHALLLALHDAAWLHEGIRLLPDDPTPEQIAEARGPGIELYQALFEPKRRVAWRCPNVSRRSDRGKSFSPKLLDVLNKRIAVAHMGRPLPLPSGERLDRYLVVDLRLLAREEHPGFHLACDHCHRVHLFERRKLAKWTDNTYPETGPAEPSDPPSEYPSIDQAAFAQIEGPYASLELPLRQEPENVYVSLTEHRQQQLDQYRQDHPGTTLAHESLLKGPFVRVPDDHGRYRLQHGIYPPDPERRIWEWPPPGGSENGCDSEAE